MTKSKKFIDNIQNKMGDITYKMLIKRIKKNISYNYSYLKKGSSIKFLKNQNFGKKKIAIIIGSGPSLKRNDQTTVLKKCKDKVIIIASDGSLFYCLKNNIVPDLVVTLDSHPTRIVRWFGDENLNLNKLRKDDYFRRQDLDIDFRKEMLANNLLLKLTNKFGKKLNIALCTTSSNAVVKRLIKMQSKIYWWNPFVDDPDKKNSISRKIFNKNKLPLINSGGNTGSAAWMIADCVLGCRKIAMIGMDFAYYNDTKLNRTQYYDFLTKYFSRKNIYHFFKKIYNPITKSNFYTDHVYYWYRKCFFEMLSNTNSITYNCTGGGILFGKSIKFVDLKTFCNRYI
jgi:hypothetical protein